MDRIIEAVSDIALVVEPDGIISDVHLGSSFESEEVSAWLGKDWASTVTSGTRSKIRRLIDQARAEGVSTQRQVNHKLPSGSEVAVGYTVVRLGDSDSVLAVGRSMEAVSDLQRKLVDAQQRMERDFWRLRQVETRYRLLFSLSSEAVLLVDPQTLEVLDANQAAADALGIDADDLMGAQFPVDRFDKAAAFRETMLPAVLATGTAPGLAVTLLDTGRSWFLKTSLVQQEGGGGSSLFVHLHTRGMETPATAAGADLQLRLLDRAPDGFVVTDESGKILHANPSFLEMAGVSSADVLVGRGLDDWLGRPGADLTVLLTNLERYGVVRMFPTQIVSAAGSDVDVELSAVHVERGGAGYCGIMVRHVGRRIERADSGGDLARAVEGMTSDLGHTPLRKLVHQTVALVERHFIEAALDLTGDNRTAASELLGLSRQSLYTKLRKYDIQGGGADDEG
ncbi:MAG: transcriptional regulator PpsR [Thioalkalivibrio sp.]|nr:transcriptional regulator PpsR [Thioalkalivibrio sp.]